MGLPNHLRKANANAIVWTMVKPGKALKQWRDGKGLSQDEAGKLMDPPVFQGTWAAWETGRKPPSLGNALEIERLTKGGVPARAWVPAHRRPRRCRRPEAQG